MPASVFRRPARAALGVLLLLCGGCAVDTEIVTVVAADGTVSRLFALKLKDLERKKEGEVWPVKRFRLPAPPAWVIGEDGPDAFSARAECKPGQPVPGGYERSVPCLGRSAANAVKLVRRDHFIAVSWSYEERWSDVVKEEEFKPGLLGEYDRYTARMLEQAEAEIGATHDLTPVRRYATKDLRKLFADTAESAARNGPWTAALTTVGRLYFGGFPLKPSQLEQADARQVLGLLVRHCLGKAPLRPDAQQGLEDAQAAARVRELAEGNAGERAAAKKTVLEWGPKILRRLEEAAPKEKEAAAAARLEDAAKEIRAALATRVDVLVTRLVKETEEHYLRPPAAEKDEVEKSLARMLGGHIEATFAPCDHYFLVKVRLPGELAWTGPDGQPLADGAVRWNFSALHFFLREYVCAARSRVWDEEQAAALGQALLGGANSLTLKQRGGMEEALAKLDGAALAPVLQALRACVEQKGRAPLETLSADGALSVAAACAKEILQQTAAKPKP